MTISLAIARARKRRKLSQVQLAKKMRVSPSTIAGWELGLHMPRSSRMHELARVLKTPVSKLLAT